MSVDYKAKKKEQGLQIVAFEGWYLRRKNFIVFKYMYFLEMTYHILIVVFLMQFRIPSKNNFQLVENSIFVTYPFLLI
uniref:Putative ovule protein n=1 Tax=Solanum chacoense TaxID=4108 RepID=A0A0V0H1M8_SOLCH